MGNDQRVAGEDEGGGLTGLNEWNVLNRRISLRRYTMVVSEEFYL
jgi:hypothetical protein